MKNKKLIILFLMLALLAASALGFAGFSRFDNAWVRGWLNVSGNSVFNGTITSEYNVTAKENMKVGTGDAAVDIYYDSDVFFNTSDNLRFNNKICIGCSVTPAYDLVVAGNVLFNTSVGKEFFFNASNGYVGIGTMSPTYTLHVIGNASISDNLTVDTNTLYVDSVNNRVAIGATSPNVTFHVSGNANVTGTLSTGSFEIQNAGAGTMNISGQTLLATDAGNVGIGNRNPNVTLHVSGRVNITGYLEVGKGLNVSNGMNVLSGNVGIGTNSPQNKLEVIGATTLAGGVNASSLNVTGFSITDDSLVTLADGSKKKIKDIIAGEEVLTLDEETGKLVPRKVNALLDHGIKPIYEMATEDGRAINTTGEHPYFVKVVKSDMLGSGATSKSSSFKVIKYPSKSLGSDFFLSSLENADKKASGLSCGILSQIIENIFSFGNETGLVKSSSFVTKTRFSDLENDANLPLESPFGLNVTLYPSDFKNVNNSFFTFSSSRNLSCERDTDGDIIPPSSQVSSIMQSCFDMILCERCYETCDYLFNRHSSFNHLQNLPDHNSSAFKSWLSVADFAVRNDELVDFDSHEANNDNAVFKDIAQWLEVRYLKVGDEIAVPDYENCEKENKKSLNLAETIIAESVNSNNKYLNISSTSSNNATVAQLGRASASRADVLADVRVQKLNQDGSPGSGVSSVGCGITFVKISSIKQLEAQHVYDLSIEGTRNFIANDIVAHNTYLATSSGNVGIGKTSPNYKLDVAGTINASGLLLTNNSFSITQAGTIGVNTTNSGSTLTVVGTFNASGSGTGPGLYVNGGGNVGIGVTSPNYKLQVVGTANITQGTTSFRVTSDNNIIIHLE